MFSKGFLNDDILHTLFLKPLQDCFIKLQQMMIWKPSPEKEECTFKILKTFMKHLEDGFERVPWVRSHFHNFENTGFGTFTRQFHKASKKDKSPSQFWKLWGNILLMVSKTFLNDDILQTLVLEPCQDSFMKPSKKKSPSWSFPENDFMKAPKWWCQGVGRLGWGSFWNLFETIFKMTSWSFQNDDVQPLAVHPSPTSPPSRKQKTNVEGVSSKSKLLTPSRRLSRRLKLSEWMISQVMKVSTLSLPISQIQPSSRRCLNLGCGVFFKKLNRKLLEEVEFGRLEG